MKVLVATKETQGKRENDFCFVPEGEMVHFSMECGGEQIDGTCGCRRSMGGLVTHTGTTTMKVVEMDIDRGDYRQKLKEGLVSEGWITEDTPDHVDDDLVEADLNALLLAADGFDAGMVIEKRGNTFRER